MSQQHQGGGPGFVCHKNARESVATRKRREAEAAKINAEKNKAKATRQAEGLGRPGKNH